MNPTANPNGNNAAPAILEQLRLRAGGSEMYPHCSLKILNDSRENFPAWLDAVRAAERSVLVEMYIFSDNAFGRQMRDLLLQKCAQGVQVVLVYDWFGSLWQDLKGFFRPLKQAGALVVAYNRMGFASGIGLLSRNHRKSIVVDGETAFVSGLCISSAWEGQPEKGIAPWRDTGVMLRGAVVADVVRALADSLQSQGFRLPEALLPESRRPENENGGDARVGIVATTPADNNMMRLDLVLLALTNRRLWLTDAYFMPTRLYTQALINAAEAGVDVRILVPKTSDIGWIARVSRTRYRELLRAGVRIFEWNGTMIHAKTAVADGFLVRIGSTNLNFSSWHFNRELDTIAEDAAAAAQMERQFLQDLNNATEIVLDADEQRAVAEQRRRKLLNLKILHRQQALAVWRQMLQLSHAFEGNFYGTNQVGSRETGAYLGLGLTLLAAALLLWFFPKLLVVPLVFLLAVGALSTLMYAVKQYLSLHRRKPPQ